MLALFKDESAADLYIDLGTANTLIATKEKGLVINEPTLIAFSEQGGKRKIVGIGNEAREKIAKTPGHLQSYRPLKDGVIADFDTTENMLKFYLQKLGKNNYFGRPRVIISLPFGATEVEKKAIIKAGKTAGARDVYLVDEPMVSAIGAGLPVREPKGSMIVDIGGGTTEVAVIALTDIVVCESLKIGGNIFDAEILKYFKNKHKLVLTEASCEQVKIQHATACPKKDIKQIEISGRDQESGLHKVIHTSTQEVGNAIEDSITHIINLIHSAIEKTPPELVSDIIESGVVVTGGGALIKDIDIRLQNEIRLSVRIAPEPLTAIAKGGEFLLQNQALLDRITLE
jgi:rod shape-determining protein MreB